MKSIEFNEANKTLYPEISKKNEVPKILENKPTSHFEKPISKENNKDELRIRELREALQEKNTYEPPKKNDIKKSANQYETVVIGGKQILVKYVPKESIYPAFGYGGGSGAIIREDLSPRVKRFVKSHELYHCIDKAKWGGWIGGEIRANVIPGLKDPIGFASTAWATISDIDRIKFYLKRIKNKH